MKPKELNVGVIGLGVGEAHIAGFENDTRCSVSALCDIDADKLSLVAQRYPGRQNTPNPDEILDDPNIDAVSIASYDNAHAHQVLHAIESNKHVFVEKPLCFHEEELSAIAKALHAKPHLQLSSNLILRKYPRFIRLKKLIDSCELGDVYYFDADYNYGRMEKIYNGWRGNLPFYSVVHGGGIHMIDLLLWLTNSRPVEAIAMGSRRASRNTNFMFNDTVAALLHFHDGTIAKVTANFPCVYPHFHDVTVFGSSGTWRNSPDSAWLYRSRDPDKAPERLNDPYPGVLKGDLIPSFVTAILDDTQTDMTSNEVFDAMSVSLAVERAAATGMPQTIHYY